MKKIIVFLAVILFLSFNMYAVTNYVSAGVGPADWNTNTSWSPNGIPGPDDNVTILATHTITINATSYAANLTVSGVLKWLSVKTLVVKGDYSITGTGSESGTGKIQFNAPGTLISASGTTSLAVSYYIYSARIVTAGSVINKSSTITSLQAGVTLTNFGNYTMGTMDDRVGTTFINGAGSILTLKVTGFMSGNVFTANASPNTVNLIYVTGSVPITTSGYYNLILGSSSGTKTLSTATTIANNLTINTGNILDSNGKDITIGGNWSNAGTFTAGTRTVTLSGTGAQAISGNSTSFYNLTKNAGGTTTLVVNTVVTNLLNISSGIFNASTFGLTGAGGLTETNGELQLGKLAVTLPELSGAYNITGGKVTFNGAGAQTIRGATYFNVDISGSGTKTSGGATDIDGTLTISSILDMSGSNYALSCAGNWINDGTFTPRNGTVTFDGTTTVSGASTTTFNNVTISGTLTGHATTMNVAGNWSNGGTYTHNSGTVVFNGTTTVSGASTTGFNNVTISGTLTGHATSMNVAGNWSNGGTYTHNSGTVVFNGTTTVSGASTTSFNNVTISGTLTGHATTMNVAGNWSNGGTYTHNSGTVVFNGTTTVSGASTTSFNNVSISGTLTGHSTNMNVFGNFTNNGVYNHNNGTVTFNGSAIAAQSISSTGASTFYGLTINNTGGGVILSSGSYLLNDALTLSNGTFNVNNLNFTMVATPAKYSRIAPVTGTGAISNAGTFNVQRFVSARDTTWCDIASPNNGTMANWDNNLYFSYPHNAVTYNPFSNVVKYNEVLYRYEGVSAATVLTPGKGFEVFLTDDASFSSYTPVTLTTVGTPNIARPAIALSYTAGAGAYAGQNLIGNPYASAVTIGSMTFTNASSTVDVYDFTTENYASVSGPGGIIGPGQGFWAYATSVGASVLIPETAKSVNQTTDIRSTIIDDPYMTLKLSSADNSHHMAYTFKIASNENALDGWDPQDHPFRKSHNKSAPSITSNVEDKNLAINTFNSLNDNYIMPLNTQAGISGFYKIEVAGLEFMEEYKYIMLEDKLLNKMTDLKTNQVYSFKLNSSDKQDRFVLHFSKTNQPIAVANKISNDFQNQIEILPTIQGNTINFNLDETTSTTITVTNIIGQTIVDGINIDANNQSVNVSLPEGYSGMYILRIESEKGIINKKFVKK